MPPDEELNIIPSLRDRTERVNELPNDEDRKYIEEKKKLYHPETRLWVFKEVQKWLEPGVNKFQKQKVFWITGSAGTGKTVISAKLEDELDEGVVIAYHFCRHDLPKKNSSMQILLSLGKLISKNMNSEEPLVKEEDINSNNIDIVFHEMLEKPLKNLRKSKQEPRKIIILDALDEIESGSLQEFLHVITKYFPKLPDWVGIFITSRHHTNIADELNSSKFDRMELCVDEERNLADLQTYIRCLTKKYKISNDFKIEYLEREIEEKFNLQRNSLNGKLKTFQDRFDLSHMMYSKAIEEIKEHEPDFDSLIGKIGILRDPSLKQDVNDFEVLYEQAKVAHKKFGGWLEETFGKPYVVDPGVKKKDRCKEKIRLDYENNASRIRDISRFTLKFDIVQDLFDAYKKIEKCNFVKVVQVKNKYLNPDTVGNRDINLNIEVKISPSQFHISELQLNLSKVLDAKERSRGHYEHIRTSIPEQLKTLNLSIEEKKSERLERFIIKSFHSPIIDVIVSKLMTKSAGLFQYAKLLEDTMAHLYKTKSNINYDEMNALPKGLDDMYQVNFDRVFSINNKINWKECEDFISLVCAAQEPLPKQIVMEILTKEKYTELQTKISLLFPEINGKVHIIHKSIVDWLRRSKNIDENDVYCEDCFNQNMFVQRIIYWSRNNISIKNKYDFSESENDHKEIVNPYFIDESMIEKAHGELAGHSLNLLLPIAKLSSKTQKKSNLYAIKYAILHAHQSKNRYYLHMIRNKLLFNIEWLIIKIKQVGPYECLEDYLLLSSLNPTDRPVQLMKHALQLSLPALYKDTGQLYSQLLGGRLSMLYEKKSFKEIELLLEDLNEYIVKKKPLTKDDYCWKPLTQYLTPAGNPCEMIMMGHTNPITSVSFSPDGKHIVSGGRDKSIRIWNVMRGKCKKVLEGHTHWISSVSFSPDGNYIASGSWDKTIRIWNVLSGKCDKVLEGDSDYVHSVSFSPDGKYLASGSGYGAIRIWNVMSGKCEKVLEGHTDDVNAISFSPDGKYIASGSWDKTIRIWNVMKGKCDKVLVEHIASVTSVSFSPNGKYLASGSEDKSIRIWNVMRGKCEKGLEGHTHYVKSVSFSPDGKYLASGSRDKTIRIWNVMRGKCEKVFEGHADWVTSVSFGPDGEDIATGSGDKTIRIWNIISEKCEKVPERHTDWVYSVSFSTDGKYTASGSRDKSIRIWNVMRGKCEKVLEGHTDWVTSVSFSPDGNYIASGSRDKTIRIWNVMSGKCDKVLEGHTDFVQAVSFSPDGKQVASGSGDKSIRIWNVMSGKCEKVFEGQSDLSSLPVLPGNTILLENFKGFLGDIVSKAYLNRDKSICVVVDRNILHILCNQRK